VGFYLDFLPYDKPKDAHTTSGVPATMKARAIRGVMKARSSSITARRHFRSARVIQRARLARHRANEFVATTAVCPKIELHPIQNWVALHSIVARLVSHRTTLKISVKFCVFLRQM
jgi:hypothetical protein